MKIIKYFLYTLLGIIFLTSCKEAVVVKEIQKIEIRIDTTYTYIYKVKRKNNFYDILKTQEKYKINDTIVTLYP